MPRRVEEKVERDGVLIMDLFLEVCVAAFLKVLIFSFESKKVF